MKKAKETEWHLVKVISYLKAVSLPYLCCWFGKLAAEAELTTVSIYPCWSRPLSDCSSGTTCKLSLFCSYVNLKFSVLAAGLCELVGSLFKRRCCCRSSALLSRDSKMKRTTTHKVVSMSVNQTTLFSATFCADLTISWMIFSASSSV